MEYTEELTLVSLTPTQDTIGQITFTENTRDVFARENLVGTKEFYNAMAVGLTPTAELQMRRVDYQNEREVIFRGERFAVIRTIPKGKFDIVLVIGLKQGIKNENTDAGSPNGSI